MQMIKIADISKYQGKPDFKKLAKSVDALIIRVQYGSSTEDPNHAYDEAHAINEGIPFGEYAFGHFISVADAIVEAKDFVKRANKEAKFLVLDVESLTIKSCGTANIAKASQAFIDVCKQAGFKTGFYVSHNLYKKYGLDKVKADFLWLPRYGADNGSPSEKPDYPCDLWQYTSKGHVDGINGYVDLSTLNGNKDLNWFIGKSSETNNTKEKSFMEKFEDMFKDELENLKKLPVSKLAEEYLKEAQENGYFDGTAPQGLITREETATVINRLRHNFLGLIDEMNKRIDELENKVK